MKHICKNCEHRDNDGYCQSEKIVENNCGNYKSASDMLVYDYYEDGGFWVGENFGCIHWMKKE